MTTFPSYRPKHANGPTVASSVAEEFRALFAWTKQVERWVGESGLAATALGGAPSVPSAYEQVFTAGVGGVAAGHLIGFSSGVCAKAVGSLTGFVPALAAAVAAATAGATIKSVNGGTVWLRKQSASEAMVAGGDAKLWLSASVPGTVTRTVPSSGWRQGVGFVAESSGAGDALVRASLLIETSMDRRS